MNWCARRSLTAGAFLSALPLTVGCGEKAGLETMRQQRPPVTVEIVTVARAPIRNVLDLVGQLEADESVLIKSETSGVIGTVEFQEGQAVHRGDLLFHLQDDEQQARLEEATALLTLAEDAYRRAKTLAAKNAISDAEFDRANAEWQAAKARRDLARVELERTEIRAPFEGVLGVRFVSPGDRVDTDTGLVRIDAVERLRLMFTVPEIVVPIARTALPVEVHVAAFPDETFEGEVYFVAPSLDASNRRLLLKAWVPNREHRLRPGMFANVRLEVARHEDAIVVPESAIAYDAEGTFVWRVGQDDVVTRLPVEIGIRREAQVEVVAGLQVGDRIVSAGTNKVSVGAKVQAAEPIVARPGAGTDEAGDDEQGG